MKKLIVAALAAATLCGIAQAKADTWYIVSTYDHMCLPSTSEGADITSPSAFEKFLKFNGDPVLVVKTRRYPTVNITIVTLEERDGNIKMVDDLKTCQILLAQWLNSH